MHHPNQDLVGDHGVVFDEFWQLRGGQSRHADNAGVALHLHPELAELLQVQGSLDGLAHQPPRLVDRRRLGLAHVWIVGKLVVVQDQVWRIQPDKVLIGEQKRWCWAHERRRRERLDLGLVVHLWLDSTS